MILAAPERAHAVVARQPAKRLPVLYAAKVSGEIRQAVNVLAIRRRDPASRFTSAIARNTAVISALELLMPAETGSVFRKEKSTPASGGSKFRATRRATVIG